MGEWLNILPIVKLKSFQGTHPKLINLKLPKCHFTLVILLKLNDDMHIAHTIFFERPQLLCQRCVNTCLCSPRAHTQLIQPKLHHQHEMKFKFKFVTTIPSSTSHKELFSMFSLSGIQNNKLIYVCLFCVYIYNMECYVLDSINPSFIAMLMAVGAI